MKHPVELRATEALKFLVLNPHQLARHSRTPSSFASRTASLFGTGMTPPLSALYHACPISGINTRFAARFAGNIGPRSNSPDTAPNGCTHNVQNETVLRLVLPHCIQMRVSDLTAKQLISVPCPTCGVAPGKRCVLHSGAPRSEPHVDRKLSAAEAIKTKRILPGPGRR